MVIFLKAQPYMHCNVDNANAYVIIISEMILQKTHTVCNLYVNIYSLNKFTLFYCQWDMMPLIDLWVYIILLSAVVAMQSCSGWHAWMMKIFLVLGLVLKLFSFAFCITFQECQRKCRSVGARSCPYATYKNKSGECIIPNFFSKYCSIDIYLHFI